MPRPSSVVAPLAVLAFVPLFAEPSPAFTPAPAAPKADAPITDVTLPDLTELGKAPNGAVLRRLVEMARLRVGEVKDPEERAVVQGTLDAIAADPSMTSKLLAAHAIRLAEVRDKAPDIIFLRGLKECKTDAEVLSLVNKFASGLDHIGDASLKLSVRLTLAKLRDKPADKDKIYAVHMKQVGARFYEAANASFKANDARGAFSSIQIAVRCDPANLQARFLFGHLLQTVLGDTYKAIQTMGIGLEFLDPASPESRPYLDRYFQLLESRERDDEVVKDTATLLAKEGFDASCREMLGMHMATCLYFTGRCDDALTIIARERLDARPQGLLLKSKALFDGRRTDAATRTLEDAVSKYQGAERDAVLSQLQRFWAELGKNEFALNVADQRAREFPDKPTPRVHRLWLFQRMGDVKRFNAEVAGIFADFGTNQGAMLGVATFASEHAMPDLAADCFRRAANLNFNRPIFALLELEARVNAKQYREALADYAGYIALDKTMFKSDEASVQALLAAAKAGLGDPVSKSEVERRVRAFIETPKLQPASYVSAARLMRKVGDLPSARRILEAGRIAHPWNNRIRADLIVARILSGLTDDAHGTRPTVADEIVAVAAGRRVAPRFWDNVGLWLRTEGASLPAAQLAKLTALAEANARPDLVRDETEN